MLSSHWDDLDFCIFPSVAGQAVYRARYFQSFHALIYDEFLERIYAFGIRPQDQAFAVRPDEFHLDWRILHDTLYFIFVA
jgi:hypothetical protein